MKTIRKLKEQKSTCWKRMVSAVKSQQRKLADLISQRYEKLSQRGKKIVLLCFGLIMGGTSLYLMVGSGQSSKALANVTAQLPMAIHNAPREPLITLYEYKQLMSFRHALDSLHVVNPLLYERVIQQRKGLVDSLDLLINIYQQQ